MKRLVPLLLFFAAIFSSGPAWADEIRDRLLALKNSTADISAISGGFVQEKKLDFITEPLVSQGEFYFSRPDFLRWEYFSPAPSGLEIQGGRISAWTGPPDNRQDQPAALAEAARLVAGQLLLWMNLEPEAILAVYELSLIQEAPLILKLIPRRGAAREYLEFLTVEFAPNGRTVREVIMKEPEGRTTLRFSRVAINPPPLTR